MAQIVKAKTTSFKLTAPKAKKVHLVGSFNNWNIKATPLKKDLKGMWSAKVDLRPGRHEYKFVVDGSWWNDPSCSNIVYNSFGSQNSVLEVK
jgi:1,4-alpha-glucan branching enzyme